MTLAHLAGMLHNVSGEVLPRANNREGQSRCLAPIAPLTAAFDFCAADVKR